MTNTELVSEIIEQVAGMMEFMLPIIAILSAFTFIISFLMYATMGWGRRIFRD